jgi:hypothetical protein
MNLKQLLLLITLCVSSVSSFSVSKTNINNVTDLFDTHIEDKATLLENIKQQREAGISQIGAQEGFNLICTEQEANSKASELNAIGETNLENAGRAARASEEYRFYDENEYEPDYTKPGNLMHKEDMNMIAKGTNNLLSSLLGKLKELDIDCKTVAGPILKEPVYYIDIKREEEKQTDYDQFFCEEPRNKYTCQDVLSLKCKDQGLTPAGLRDVTGNMTHSISSDGVLTIGVNQERYFYNSWGSQQDFTFSFEVTNAAGINSFKLLQVDWADYVLITLNDHIIFQAPGMNGRLEMSTNPDHYRRADNDERFYGVDIGVGDYVSANTRRYHASSPHMEAKHLLKDGRNILNIRLVYGNGGKIWTQFSYTEKICNSWIETWDEKCTLN